MKVSVYSLGLGIWVSSTSFSKSNIGWPQQHPTEKVLKFNMGFHDSVKIFFFQNTKISDISPQIIDFKNLDDSVVIFQALQTSAASLTSAASAASLALTAFTAIFPQTQLRSCLDFAEQVVVRIHEFVQVLLNPRNKFSYIHKHIVWTITKTSRGYANNLNSSINLCHQWATRIPIANTLN